MGVFSETNFTTEEPLRQFFNEEWHTLGFRWLDESRKWFWLQSSKERNPLLNQIKKMVAVAGEIDIGELRSGIVKQHRMEGFSPPRGVLLELCRQTPWCRVKDNKVVGDSSLDWKDILGETERTLIHVLKCFGPIMRREELEKKCLELGMNRSTFAATLTCSAIIQRHGACVYGLRGATVCPGEIESLLEKKIPTKSVIDSGWTTRREIWIYYQVTEAMAANGILSIPARMSDFLNGIYTIKAADGSPFGTLKFKDNSAWSLRQFFTRRGGEAGDFLLVVFDLTLREATVYIGDKNLLEKYRDDR